METRNNSNNNRPNVGQEIRRHYDAITNMADRINRKRMKNMMIIPDEEKLIKELINASGDLFMRVMYRIQGDVVNNLIDLGVLFEAVRFGGKVFNRNYHFMINTAKVLRPIVAKLSPAEKDQLDCFEAGANLLVLIHGDNCRAILKMAEDNFEVTLAERRDLKDLLVALRWDKEPVQKAVVKVEEKVETKKVVEKLVAVSQELEAVSTNGKAKAGKKK